MFACSVLVLAFDRAQVPSLACFARSFARYRKLWKRTVTTTAMRANLCGPKVGLLFIGAVFDYKICNYISCECHHCIAYHES